MSRALYRTHRPQKLADLVGQETITLLLRNAAATNRLGHAFLFYGSRGTGKTTTARIVAKLFNCETRKQDEAFAATGDACTTCASCSAIEQGTSLDVIEIDAASNRGIDEIRSLKDSIRTAPHGSAYKVFIIDEAHMLTGAAWNALLKTLEEPPAHGVIILATTEYDKLPATIVSRTQRFLFTKPHKTAILAKLQQIVTSEEIHIEPAALELIAAGADGSFRDAESLLDQARSLGEPITYAATTGIVGRVALEHVHTLATHVLTGTASDALAYVALLEQEGGSLTSVTKDLIHYLRKVAAVAVDPSLATSYAADLTTDEVARLIELGSQQQPAETIQIIQRLITAYREMRYAPFAGIPLEIALIECAQLRE